MLRSAVDMTLHLLLDVSNLSEDHWRAAEKVMRYFQGTKDYMLMYKRTDNFEVIANLIRTLLDALIHENQHLSSLCLMAELYLGEVQN